MSIGEDVLNALTAAGKGAVTGSVGGPIGMAGGAAVALALNLYPEIAKVLGVDSSAAAKVVSVVQSVTKATEPVAQATVVAEDPGVAADLRIQLAQIVSDHEQAMAEEQTADLKAVLSDVAGARARDVQVRSASGRNARADVMLGITVVGIVSCLSVAILGRLDGNSAIFGLVAGIVGLLSKCFADAFSFEYGSSRGSARKTELLAQQTPVPPSPGVVVPAGDVQAVR